MQAVPIRKQPDKPQAQSWQLSRTDTNCKPFPSGNNRTNHRRKVGSVPELIPVQAAHNLKPCIFSFQKHKATASRSHQETTTGAKLTGSKLAAFPN